MNLQSKIRGLREGGVHTSQRHDSAHKHVAGSAPFIDDLPEVPGLLHAAVVLSPVAHGRLRGIADEAARKMPGVARVITAADIPGANEIGPVTRGEPLLAAREVMYAGQPVAFVLATSFEAAQAAAAKVVLDIEVLPAVLTVAEALAERAYVYEPMHLRRGDAAAAMAQAPHRLTARFEVGGQEHFYLESQIALATPGEDGDVAVHSSTQNPSEVQHICAGLLGLDFNRVTVSVRRLGGGFGGKESNASWVAGAAALAAALTGRPVKCRLSRSVDMVATGKRHGFAYAYEVGFDDTGRFLALAGTLAANCGCTAEMSAAVMTRALTHVDNAYFIPAIDVTGYGCRTHTVSNTAFRGFGGPQGVMLAEDAVLRVASALGRTPEAIREVNFYGGEGRDTTPFGQRVDDNLTQRCVAQVKRDADWDVRLAEIERFNATSPVLKRGLGLFPLKFGISFNAAHLNQAGALVHVYSDGSVRLNHAGTEMGQGLFTKIAQVVAEVFQIDLDRVRLSATSTAEVPNTTATAASVGSDLNGWAAHIAADTIKARMIAHAAAHFEVLPSEVTFADNYVHIGPPGANRTLEFGEMAKLCFMGRVSLSAAGHYKTPHIHWDQAAMKGEPFFYFVFGAAVSEVAIDTLSGEARVLRADIVQDCGASLNPAIDLGQIEGAYVQGLGWLTCEELWWTKDGALRTRGPSTYKIPGSRDVPPVFNVRILEDAPARVETIFRSKGIGEPPLLLAISILTALKHAIGGLSGFTRAVDLDTPTTPERILRAVAQQAAPRQDSM